MATFTAKLRRMALPGLENKFDPTTIQPRSSRAATPFGCKDPNPRGDIKLPKLTHNISAEQIANRERLGFLFLSSVSQHYHWKIHQANHGKNQNIASNF